METCADCGKPIHANQPSYYRHDPAGCVGKAYHSACGDPFGFKATIHGAVAAERERCAQLVMGRAAKWNAAAKDGAHGDCAESLADECEDIAAAIQNAPAPAAEGETQ